MPRPTPSAEPTSPVIRASPRTEPSTCPRPAPTARSRASSRVRWPTRMLKVLKMMNAPTSSEMPANTSRNVLKKLRKESKLAAISLAAVAALTAS